MAVAVATGMCVAAVGTDTGGSIRIPAAACGVVGLKPGYGEISTNGVIPLSASLDHLGPIAGSVGDAWLLFQAMTGQRIAALDSPSGGGLNSLRIGLLGGYFLERIDADIGARLEAVVALINAAGGRSDEVLIPHAPDIVRVYTHIVSFEAMQYHAATLADPPLDYTPGVRDRLESARAVTRENYDTALAERETLRSEVDGALDSCDLLLLPTIPIGAPLVGQETISLGGSDRPVRPTLLRLTQLFNMSGHPAISIPGGTLSSALPWGIQLVGRRGDTASSPPTPGRLNSCSNNGRYNHPEPRPSGDQRARDWRMRSRCAAATSTSRRNSFNGAGSSSTCSLSTTSWFSHTPPFFFTMIMAADCIPRVSPPAAWPRRAPPSGEATGVLSSFRRPDHFVTTASPARIFPCAVQYLPLLSPPTRWPSVR